VDKTESEDKNVLGNQQECGLDPDMDVNDILSAAGLHQVPV